MNIEEAIEDLSTIRDFVRWGMSRFHEAGLHFGHGTDNALDEAAYLILNTLQLPPDTGDSYMDTRLTRSERRAVAEVIAKRAVEHIPAPYLTREAWFSGMPFYVDERVLIPRSPVAEMIETEFRPWIDPSRVHRILDLCTGSGCIAIACAVTFPDADVDAADISGDALDVATINVQRHGVSDQVRLLRSDLFDKLDGESYDVIISNPPYVDADEMNALPEEYRHEPALALEAGEDGLDLVVRMLRDAAAHLNREGVLIVEVGSSDAALEALFPDVPFTWLEFSRGGEGVFLLSAEQVEEYHDRFAAECERRRTRVSH